MPWWGWIIIVLVVVGLPIKLKVLKSMMAKRQSNQEEIDE